MKVPPHPGRLKKPDERVNHTGGLLREVQPLDRFLDDLLVG